MLKTGCFLFTIIFPLTLSAGIPEVRVLIGKSLKQIVVEGTDLQKMVHSQNKFEQYNGRKAISFNCIPPKEFSKGADYKQSQLVASLSSPTGLVSWGDQKYQGELQLLANIGKQSCDLVNNVPMETYITTLLAKEMNGSWPVEALKAQAVAARTYAFDRLKNQSNHYHLESSEKDQVSGTFSDVTEKTLKAAKETSGEILVGPSGKVSPVFFHSKCGGRTLRPDQVWGGVEEGYRSVDCPFCRNTGMKDWEHKIRNTKLTQLIDKVLKRYYSDQLTESQIKLMPDSPKNSEVRLYAGDKLHILKKSYLRNFAGREIIPSNNFTLSMKHDNFHVKGQGYGHGVGLCQLGALELAKRGYGYREILAHYFPRHKMKKIY